MEFLNDMVIDVPEGTGPAKIDESRAAEAVRAAGHLIRLRRNPSRSFRVVLLLGS